MNEINLTLLVFVFVLTVLVVGLCVYLISAKKSKRELEERANEIEKSLVDARNNSDKMVKNALHEAKQIAIREGRDFDRIQREKNQELQKAEKRIQKREETIEKKAQQLEEKEKELKRKNEFLEKEEKKITENIKSSDLLLLESQQKLENIARMSLEEAKQQLVQSIEADVRKSIAVQVKTIEDDAYKSAEDKAKSIIATSIQRLSNEFVGDACVSVITLPSDDMKGRIIGREGRNIRAIEQATGIDLIIDDTPEAVVISCFNPIRREIAKISIERLIADGRIHPARIEEVVQKVTSEFEQIIRETGESAAFECGIQGLHPDLIAALGKLKFRTSGQQSVLQHSIETAQIAGIIANELDVNSRLVKRAALLHDIGKSQDEENEGNHAIVGARLAQRCGECPEVIEAITKHHNEFAHSIGIISVIVQCANSLSAFRPGARKEFLEKAIDRLRDMEKIVSNFPEVDQAFVIRSGREIRAMVSPNVIEDEAISMLARSVAKRIKNDANHQGSVKVTMIKETKVTQVAK